MRKIVFILLIFLLSLNMFGMQYKIFPKVIQKGAVTFLEINTNTPTVYLNGLRLPVFYANKRYWVLIALDIAYPRRKIKLKIKGIGRSEEVQFFVRKFPYRVRRLKFPFRVKSYFKKEEILKYKKMNLLVHRLRSRHTKKLYFNKNFIYPLKKVRKSDLFFGDKRYIYFGKRRRKPYFHRGVDFAALKGTKVLAANTGRVVLARNLFRRGKAVIVDHGWGIFTEYLHLSKILVKKGQYLKQGDVLGEVGNSGISTGAHLHWSLVVNGILVNPLAFVKKGIAKRLKKTSNYLSFKAASKRR